MAEEKKGLFARLFGQQKKSGGCCDVRIEEIPEEDEKQVPRHELAEDRGSSCCGPAPDTNRDADPAS